MRKIRDERKYLNLRHFSIYVIVPNEQYDDLLHRITALNKCTNITCGVFRFLPRRRIVRNSTVLPPAIAEHIGDSNLFVRLIDIGKKTFRYGYDFVDFTADVDHIESELVRVVKEICDDTINICNVRIEKLSEAEEVNIQKVEESQRVRDRFIERRNLAGAELGVYKKVLNGKGTSELQISTKEVDIEHYRKSVRRYGIELSIEDGVIPIYFGDKTQTILYFAALIRFKMQRPLYLHELYKNSNGSRSIYKREKTYKWLAQIFDAVFGKTALFDKWAYPVRDGESQPRPSRDFHQAKSAITTKLSEALGEDNYLLTDLCALQIATDANGDSYYTFNCEPEDVILDERSQKLYDAFKTLYRIE